MKMVLLAMGSCGVVLGGTAEFEKPVRLNAGGKPVRVESPGYAAPCWVDIDKDGKSDLVVGQFNEGKMHLFKGLGNLQFASGEFLKAEGEVATVPGVW